MKVALVYDRINKWGGGERVLLAFQKLFPKATVYTSVYNKTRAPWAKDLDIKTSFLQNVPLASSSHEYLPTFMPLAFESFSFDEYDLVVSITSEAAKGIITKPQTLHICYCLTPTRYLWSGYDEYFKNPLFKTLSKPAVSYLRAWDTIASQRPDIMVGISKEVQKRIKKYYDRDSQLIYPPANGKWPIANGKNHTLSAISHTPYFLVVSRLVPYKRVDLAIKACNALKVPLKIIGTGSQENYLRSIASPTIEFLGSATDSEVASYYANCTALLFPGYEDLGLTILEATAFGKPIIAYKKGGAVETVIEGETGIFFENQTEKDLVLAIERIDKMRYNAKVSEELLQKFSFETFRKQFLSLVEKNI